MKRWGAALRSGDSEQLRKVLFGRQARRKLTPEIESYIRMRFPAIYEETKYEYSKRMREEIEQVFGCTLSGETLRPLLRELKESIKVQKENEETPWDCEQEPEIEEEERRQAKLALKTKKFENNLRSHPHQCLVTIARSLPN